MKPEDLQEFRLAEYGMLAELITSRDERVDRFITVYLTLAGAPFALYAVMLKDDSPTTVLHPPALVAWVWLFCGIFGIYLGQVIIQLRFSAILYARALNGLRKYFGGEKPVEVGIWMPVKTDQPAYDESDHMVDGIKRPAKYMFHIIQAMSILNGIYLALGLFFIPRFFEFAEWLRWGVPALAGLIAWQGQLWTYRESARHRESRATKSGLI